MKTVAIIPARLQSTRFPRKVLLEINGLPMIEHVRRRAMLCSMLDEVIVATCDLEIAEVINSNGGNVIITSDEHVNGTSRAGEAIEKIDCTHVVLLQGDEPLLLPRHVNGLVGQFKRYPNENAWNLVGPLESADELDRKSFVKCSIAANNSILYCYRKSASFNELEVQKKYVRKMLGILGFRREFLLRLNHTKESQIEQSEQIEQMRIIENGWKLMSYEVEPALPSINEPGELEAVQKMLDSDPEQRTIINQY